MHVDDVIVPYCMPGGSVTSMTLLNAGAFDDAPGDMSSLSVCVSPASLGVIIAGEILDAERISCGSTRLTLADAVLAVGLVVVVSDAVPEIVVPRTLLATLLGA